MKLEEKTISSEVIYKGSIVKLNLDTAELPNGKTASREVVNHPGGVTVAALTKENELLFVRQYRYPFHEIVLELPAGKMEKNSTPLENIKRELLEETGYESDDWKHLMTIPSNATMADNMAYIYVAKNCRKKSEQSLD
ncbi:MAG: NUDIX hydrolase, partial [Clostridia bacterium]|nr:NUDIX hydrolase [Clostridia bacterium]